MLVFACLLFFVLKVMVFNQQILRAFIDPAVGLSMFMLSLIFVTVCDLASEMSIRNMTVFYCSTITIRKADNHYIYIVMYIYNYMCNQYLSPLKYEFKS